PERLQDPPFTESVFENHGADIVELLSIFEPYRRPNAKHVETMSVWIWVVYRLLGYANMPHARVKPWSSNVGRVPHDSAVCCWGESVVMSVYDCECETK